ncbi:MAG: CAP domain-containing protein [Pirellulales bacterium]|nr:CAP domain-containing protein [Pirellulales bacterium]
MLTQTVFMAAAMSVTMAVSPEEAPDALALYPVEQAIVQRTNAERARNGLPPLEVDHTLVRSARRHAVWMTRARNMRHTTAPVAENIAMGQRDSREAVRSWMNSSGHRANILSRGHRKIGVAAFRTPEGTIYWCQQFRH